MNWKKTLISPFILPVIVGGIMGNFSLGLIVAGLSVLIWGYRSGVLFISITTVSLVLLTGNINVEIIFLFSISLAFLNRENIIFSYLDQRIRYMFLFILSILSFPLWKYLLGLIPAELLNQISISGEILIIAGLFLLAFRGKLMLNEGVNLKKLYNILLVFISSVLGLMGSYFLLPVWIGGRYLNYRMEDIFNKRRSKLIKINTDNNTGRNILYYLCLFLPVILAGNLLLPVGFFITTAVIIFFTLIFWQQQQIPIIEMVYFSVLVGMLAGRIGLLR